MVWTIVTGRLPGYILIDGSETMHWWFLIPAALAGALIGVLIGYIYRKNVAEAKIAKAEDAVRTLLDDAQKKAEEIRKEKELEAKEEIYKLRTEAEKENRDRRNELQRTERRLFQREETLDKKIEAVEAREPGPAAGTGAGADLRAHRGIRQGDAPRPRGGGGQARRRHPAP